MICNLGQGRLKSLFHAEAQREQRESFSTFSFSLREIYLAPKWYIITKNSLYCYLN
jgi:hypothetical protein